MRFWARVSISAFCIVLATASMGSLGRFMFKEIPQVPGLEIESARFRVAHAAADSVYFRSSLRSLKAKRFDNGVAVFQGLDYVNSPGAVRYSPWRPGVEFYFPLGLQLGIKTDLSPYLTWAEGSVGAEVPSAASRWHILNFRDGQPPLMFVFDEPVQMMVKGESGNWYLEPTERFKGWVRVLAPLGPKRGAANVAALGEMAKKIAPLAAELTRPMPNFTGLEVRSDSGYLTAIWNFDGVGAALPSPLLLSKAGGFETRVLTGVTGSLLDMAEGPVAFSREPRIAVRFPMRRIPVGQSLMVGQHVNALSSASGFDVPSVVELALSRMSAGQDELTQDVVETCAGEYRSGLHSSLDPVTGRNQLVGADGVGLDLMAAHALLEVAAGSQDLELLSGVTERWDPWSWQVVANDSKVRSRATALYSIAGAFSNDPILRARAAMAEAACAAETVIGAYANRRGLPVLVTDMPQPMRQLREALYGDVALAPNRSEFLTSLIGPVRIVSGGPVQVERDGSVYLLSWDSRDGGASHLGLVTAFPIEVAARENVASILPSTFLAETRLKVAAKEPGVVRVALRLPGWVVDLPEMVESPRYSE